VTLVCVDQVPVLSFASIVAQKASRARSVKAFDSAREIAATASEVLANARTVQSFTAEEKEAARYEIYIVYWNALCDSVTRRPGVMSQLPGLEWRHECALEFCINER
jgi:ABC-type multidrug transport system fused ATPase/permease subunit